MCSFGNEFQKGKSWIVRLLSTACLSLAAKMEELSAPMLSEYQSEDCGFDSNTIQRMELLILSTLEWRMSSVTPFAYLGHFRSKLQIDDESSEFQSKCIEFIFAIVDGMNSLQFSLFFSPPFGVGVFRYILI